MHLGRSFCLVIAALLLPATVFAQDLVIRNVHVIDGRSADVRRDVTIVVRDGRIAAIGTDETAPAGVEQIDGGGRFALPGLIDAHTHLNSLASARRALHSGVTTVRSSSVSAYQDVALREMARTGEIAGPDMHATGVFVTPRLGESVLADPRLAGLHAGVEDEAALRALVRVNLDRGVDWIKTRGTERAGLPDTDPRKQVYSERQLRVIVDEAATRDVPVQAHAHGDEGAFAAVIAGVRSIEHGTYLSDRTLQAMRERGTYLVPTFATVYDLTQPGGDYDDPVLTVRGQHMLPRLAGTIRRAHAAGVPIVTGADTGYGPESTTRIAHEVAFFVELGMTPLEALRSATSVAAAMLRIEDRTGTLETGREADLILVEGNPLEDIAALQDVLVVISNGRVGMNRLPFGLP